MRKQYMKPRMEAIEIAVQQMLAYSGGGGPLGIDPDGDSSDKDSRAAFFDDPVW